MYACGSSNERSGRRDEISRRCRALKETVAPSTGLGGNTRCRVLEETVAPGSACCRACIVHSWKVGTGRGVGRHGFNTDEIGIYYWRRGFSKELVGCDSIVIVRVVCWIEKKYEKWGVLIRHRRIRTALLRVRPVNRRIPRGGEKNQQQNTAIKRTLITTKNSEQLLEEFESLRELVNEDVSFRESGI